MREYKENSRSPKNRFIRCSMKNSLRNMTKRKLENIHTDIRGYKDVLCNHDEDTILCFKYIITRCTCPHVYYTD